MSNVKSQEKELIQEPRSMRSRLCVLRGSCANSQLEAESALQAGIAITEAALALMVLIPMGIMAVALWNYLGTLQEVSQLVTVELSKVETRSFILTNGETDFEVRLNEAALRHSVDELIERVEKALHDKLRREWSAYRIEAALVDRTPEGMAQELGYRTIYVKTAGDLAAPGAFNSAATLASLGGGEQVTRDAGVLTNKLAGIGLSVSIKPRGEVLSTIFGEGSGLGIVSASKMADLRGEFVWQ